MATRNRGKLPFQPTPHAIPEPFTEERQERFLTGLTQGSIALVDPFQLDAAEALSGHDDLLHRGKKRPLSDMLTVMNLPQHIRNKPGSIMLAGIIPGNNEPKDTDPYVRVLVDEILELNNLTVHDAMHNEDFQAEYLCITWTTQDKTSSSTVKIDRFAGANAYAGCVYCCTHGEYCKHLTKIVYLGNRSFLQDSDPLHGDRKNFPAEKDPRKPPALKTMEYITEANQRYSDATSAKATKEIAQETGCKGSYALQQLPGHDRISNCPVDPMHLIKNLGEHVVSLISGVTDTHKVRAEEKSRKRFRSAWPSQDGSLPPAPFCMTKQERGLANTRALSIQVPHTFDWRPRPLFVSKGVGMKSHEWKEVVCSGVLKYCVRGLLGSEQRATLFEFCDVLSMVCSEVVCASELVELERRVHRVLSLLERDFPVSLQVIVFHLLHHLPLYLQRFGPVYGYWITRRVLN